MRSPHGDLALQYPNAETIHLVVDDLNIHCRKSLTDALGEDVGDEVWDRFTVHHTPNHGSWLNQAEIQITMFSKQCLGKRRLADLRTLRRETRAWTRRVNRDTIKINWTFDRKAARKAFAIRRTLSGGHRTSYAKYLRERY